MVMEKARFLQNDFLQKLATLSADAKPLWGKMNGQQMVEHFTDALCIANGKHPVELINTGERLEKAYHFLMSDVPFKENTNNPLMPETPADAKHAAMVESLKALKIELDDFFKAYEAERERRITNPFFGPLNFEEQVQLLYKHAQHHLKQFGL